MLLLALLMSASTTIVRTEAITSLKDELEGAEHRYRQLIENTLIAANGKGQRRGYDGRGAIGANVSNGRWGRPRPATQRAAVDAVECGKMGVGRRQPLPLVAEPKVLRYVQHRRGTEHKGVPSSSAAAYHPSNGGSGKSRRTTKRSSLAMRRRGGAKGRRCTASSSEASKHATRRSACHLKPLRLAACRVVGDGGDNGLRGGAKGGRRVLPNSFENRQPQTAVCVEERSPRHFAHLRTEESRDGLIHLAAPVVVVP